MDALSTCLWFDTRGEEAANFYAGLVLRIPGASGMRSAGDCRIVASEA
jgi:hypothetical protein